MTEKQYEELIARIKRLEVAVLNIGGAYTGMNKSWEEYIEREISNERN